MIYFWLDVYQQLTRQVCMCKHTKRHHIKLAKDFADRSDVQCLDFVFEGGSYGEHGRLGCCQCLSYHQKELPFGYWFYKFKSIFIKPYYEKVDAVTQCKHTFCVCGHSAFDHDIGNDERIRIDVLYPACNLCSCKEYDYVNNPSISTNKITERSSE